MLITCWKTTVHLFTVALSITLLAAHQRWAFLSTEDENIMAYMASSAIWSLWGIALDEAHTALKGSSHQGYWLTVRYGQYLETGQYLLTHPAVLCAGVLGEHPEVDALDLRVFQEKDAYMREQREVLARHKAQRAADDLERAQRKMLAEQEEQLEE